MAHCLRYLLKYCLSECFVFVEFIRQRLVLRRYCILCAYLNYEKTFDGSYAGKIANFITKLMPNKWGQGQRCFLMMAWFVTSRFSSNFTYYFPLHLIIRACFTMVWRPQSNELGEDIFRAKRSTIFTPSNGICSASKRKMKKCARGYWKKRKETTGEGLRRKQRWRIGGNEIGDKQKSSVTWQLTMYDIL